ncbi:hypothetical protein EST38_g14524 [Candolleomyces aberdarensis]|uniref:F-box domain-containing protein n=1 Tax=Candolleomyces aberdarensis TaxID=2316362 RepID=A0A4Q2CZF4_9AGAR|nr:hypothetical protein EST38_g14524 [Candolleomyces aberdarensis]
MTNKLCAYYISTNAPPSDTEAASLQTEINDLLARVAQTEERIRRRRSVLSAVRRLPEEILGEIFVCLLPEILDFRGRTDLITLCLVCKSWRNAAMLCHRLWRGLGVCKSQLSFDGVIKWLERSAALPKALEVLHEEGDDGIQLASTALSRLLVEGLFLDHLTLEWPDTGVLLDALEVSEVSKLSRPLDHLKSLTLDLTSLWDSQRINVEPIFLNLPPTVICFQIHLPWYDADIFEHLDPFLDLPESFSRNLCALTIVTDWNVRHTFELLKYCSNLETLTLVSGRPPYPLDDLIEPIPLKFPKLQTLKVENAPFDLVANLAALTTPSLLNLDIQFAFYDDFNSAPHRATQYLHSFLASKSNCAQTLQSLNLGRLSGVPTDKLVQILEHLPSLTCLALCGLNTEEHGGLFYALFHRRKNSNGEACKSILPCLEVLELIEVDQDYDFYWLPRFINLGEPRRLQDANNQLHDDHPFQRLTVSRRKRTIGKNLEGYLRLCQRGRVTVEVFGLVD